MPAQPSIPPEIVAELQEDNLVIWHASHPDGYDMATGKMKPNRERVSIQLAGPKIGEGPWGFGSTVREAVDFARSDIRYRAKLDGLDGALARLGLEVNALTIAVLSDRYKNHQPQGGFDPDLDDDVPF